MRWLCVAVLCVALFSAVPSQACTLRWTPPTLNTDGSPIDPLGGYFVYVRPVGTLTFVRQAETVSPVVSSVTLTCVQGEYYLTAWYVPEVESAPSNIWRVKKPRPGTQLAIAP